MCRTPALSRAIVTRQDFADRAEKGQKRSPEPNLRRSAEKGRAAVPADPAPPASMRRKLNETSKGGGGAKKQSTEPDVAAAPQGEPPVPTRKRDGVRGPAKDKSEKEGARGPAKDKSEKSIHWDKKESNSNPNP